MPQYREITMFRVRNGKPGVFRTFANVLICALLGLLSACGSNDEKDLATSSAITFSGPGFFLAPGSTLAWRSDLVYLFEDARRKPVDATPILQGEIQAYLESRTYLFPEDRASADYGLVAVLVLGDGMTATEVLKEFKLTPSFGASRQYEKGTLIVAIYNASNEKILWRGALQANVDIDLPPDQRRPVMQLYINKLLGKVPMEKPR